VKEKEIERRGEAFAQNIKLIGFVVTASKLVYTRSVANASPLLIRDRLRSLGVALNR
jgi:hypothetical protein